MIVRKIYSVWEDLERSYSTMSKGKSRRDFLLILVGYNDGSTEIDKMKEMLLKDYTGNETICDLLFKVLDAISLNLERLVNMTSDIEDLDKFVGELVAEVGQLSVTQNFKTLDLHKLNPLRKKDVYVSLEDLVTECGMVGDCYFVVEGRPVTYLVSEDKDIVFLKLGSLSSFMLKCNEKDPFYLKCSNILKYLIHKGYNLDHPVLFLGDRHHTYVGKKVSMSFKNKAFNLELLESVTCDGVKAHITNFNNIHRSSLVICVC